MNDIVLTDEQKKYLKNFGNLQYPASKIASILEIDANWVESQMKNPNSELMKNYQTGFDYAQYLIDLKLFEMAKSGDLKALAKYEERQRILKRES